MSEPTHQTVHLERGKHRDPAEGVCVMELASMLAEEPFSDHPLSVCPVIGAVLRAYNDNVLHDRRQELYRFASLAVGTKAGDALQARRIELCREWITSHRGERRRGLRRLVPPTALPGDVNEPETVGVATARLAIRRARRDPRVHAEFLAFVERLVRIGDEPGARQPFIGTGTAAPTNASVPS
jgi:hypothetical protein